MRKIGSVPSVASNRARTFSGVIVHPAPGWWQVTHARPLPPRLWKTGLAKSIDPVVEYVPSMPVALGARAMEDDAIGRRHAQAR